MFLLKDFILKKGTRKEDKVMIRIREIRMRKNLNQKELSEKIGVVQNTLSQWESGKNEPCYTRLIQIADILSVSTDELLGRDSPTDTA